MPPDDPRPWVTCLCPTYGRFERLREALACFLAQDYPNRRLIILNDAPHRLTKPDHPDILDGLSTADVGCALALWIALFCLR